MSKYDQIAERIRLAMALDRKSFKSKVLGILGGAITHYYMVKLATLNRQTKWVQHWSSEVDRLINADFVIAVDTEIKGKWDKRKAITETLVYVAAGDHRYRTTAANYVAKVYKRKKINQDLPTGVEKSFYEMVQQATERALSP
jgi:hypothetical protein